MNALELIESFSEFKEFKNIDRETMMNILQDVFRSMLKKKYGSDDHIDVIINPDKGDVEIWINREIVPDGEVEDDNLEIALSKAVLIEPDFEVGEEVAEEVKLGDFGRRNVLSLRQNLISRILELEKDHIYKKYKERIGEIITGELTSSNLKSAQGPEAYPLGLSISGDLYAVLYGNNEVLVFKDPEQEPILISLEKNKISQVKLYNNVLYLLNNRNKLLS